MIRAKDVQAQPPAVSYEVFGRQRKDTCLYHLGTVVAPNASLAEVQALTTYDEHHWSELCLVPAEAFTVLVGARDDRMVGLV